VFIVVSVNFHASLQHHHYFNSPTLHKSTSKKMKFRLQIGDINNQLAPWSRALLEKLTVTQMVKKFTPLTEPECSLSCSQKPDTGHCPGPVRNVVNDKLENRFPRYIFLSVENIYYAGQSHVYSNLK
jgi:hypothetical protein